MRDAFAVGFERLTKYLIITANVKILQTDMRLSHISPVHIFIIVFSFLKLILSERFPLQVE
jgi:hypothetical protein